jgi:hypothetical protein
MSENSKMITGGKVLDSHIDRIIGLMGYKESLCLKYKRDGFGVDSFTVHTSKILEELSPYAVYMVDDEPFVLFLKNYPIVLHKDN